LTVRSRTMYNPFNCGIHFPWQQSTEAPCNEKDDLLGTCFFTMCFGLRLSKVILFVSGGANAEPHGLSQLGKTHRTLEYRLTYWIRCIKPSMVAREVRGTVSRPIRSSSI
jgi:hypothetical protein